MTVSYSKIPLSGSVNGRAIKIAAIATPGTTIHTAVTGIVNMDEIWLYVTNTHTAALDLTLEYGATTSPDNRIYLSVPSKQGLFLIVPGLILNNGLIVRAFASTANLLTISGWVNRINN